MQQKKFMKATKKTKNFQKNFFFSPKKIFPIFFQNKKHFFAPNFFSNKKKFFFPKKIKISPTKKKKAHKKKISKKKKTFSPKKFFPNLFFFYKITFFRPQLKIAFRKKNHKKSKFFEIRAHK